MKFFIGRSNDAWTMPDATLLPPLSDAGCLSCEALQKTAKSLVAKGQRYVSAPVTPKSFTTVDGAPAAQQFVRVLATQNEVNVVDRSGKVVLTDKRKSLALTASAVWKGGRWWIYDIA